MNWSNERYVRLYTRDTSDWLLLSWQAQALLCLLLRKADRLGEIDLGRHGLKGVAAHVKMPWKVAEPALEELLADGVVHREDREGRLLLVFKNYTIANESTSAGAERMRRYRERHRDAREASPRDETSPGDVTGDAHGGDGDVTRDGVTHKVTPIRSVPSDPSVPKAARVRARDGTNGPYSGPRAGNGNGAAIPGSVRSGPDCCTRCGKKATAYMGAEHVCLACYGLAPAPEVKS